MPQPGGVRIADFGNRSTNVSVSGGLLGSILPRAGEAIADHLFGMNPQMELQHEYALKAQKEREDAELAQAFENMRYNSVTPQAALETQGLEASPEMQARLQAMNTPERQMQTNLVIARQKAAGVPLSPAQEQIWSKLNAADGEDPQGQFTTIPQISPYSSEALNETVAMLSQPTVTPQLSAETRARAEVISNRLSASLQALNDVAKGTYDPKTAANMAFLYRSSAQTSKELFDAVSSDLGLSGRIGNPLAAAHDAASVMLGSQLQNPQYREFLKKTKALTDQDLAKLDKDAVEANARLGNKNLTMKDLAGLMELAQPIYKNQDPLTAHLNLTKALMLEREFESNMADALKRRELLGTQIRGAEQNIEITGKLAPLQIKTAEQQYEFAKQTMPLKVQQLEQEIRFAAQNQGININDAAWKIQNRDFILAADNLYKMASLELSQLNAESQTFVTKANMYASVMSNSRDKAAKLYQQAKDVMNLGEAGAAQAKELNHAAGLAIQQAAHAEALFNAMASGTEKGADGVDTPQEVTARQQLKALVMKTFGGVDTNTHQDAVQNPMWWVGKTTLIQTGDKAGRWRFNLPQDRQLWSYAAQFVDKTMLPHNLPLPTFEAWQAAKTIPVAPGVWRSPKEHIKDPVEMQRLYQQIRDYHQSKGSGQ